MYAMIIKPRFLTAALMALAVSGCGNDEQTVALAQGQSIVEQNCLVCHSQGLNGAPIIGNQTMWGPRVNQGESLLIEHASNGYRMMPARGGNHDLTDTEITLAVRYFLSRLEH